MWENDYLSEEEALKRGLISEPVMNDQDVLSALIRRSPAADAPSASLSPQQLLTPVTLKGTKNIKEETKKQEEGKKEESPSLTAEDRKKLEEATQNVPANISAAMASAKKVLEDQKKKFSALADAEKEQNTTKINAAYQDLQKASEKAPTMGELVAQLLIGLAPAAIGYVAAPAVGITRAAGTYAGAEAGEVGSKAVNAEFEKRRQRALDAAKESYKTAVTRGLTMEKARQQGLNEIEKQLAELPATEVKAVTQMFMMQPETLRKIYEANTPKVTKTTGKEEDKKLTDEKDTKQTLPGQKGAGSSKPKETDQLSPDLGYGFRMKAGFSKQDRVNAQKFVSKYGSVKPLFDDLENALEQSNFKSVSTWTEAGENLRAKAMALQSALISITERGASLTGTEKDLVESLGMRLDGSGKIVEKFKIAMNPKQIVQRLRAVDALLAQQTAGKITPYMGERVQPEVKKDLVQGGNVFRWDATSKQYKFLKKVGK